MNGEPKSPRKSKPDRQTVCKVTLLNESTTWVHSFLIFFFFINCILLVLIRWGNAKDDSNVEVDKYIEVGGYTRFVRIVYLHLSMYSYYFRFVVKYSRIRWYYHIGGKHRESGKFSICVCMNRGNELFLLSCSASLRTWLTTFKTLWSLPQHLDVVFPAKLKQNWENDQKKNKFNVKSCKSWHNGNTWLNLVKHCNVL